MIEKAQITLWLKRLQDSICQNLEILNGNASFKEDIWHRDGGGGGRTRIIEGHHIEKGGVNFSAIWGEPPEFLAQTYGTHKPEFFATGLSIVLHPTNPFMPSIHSNIRYFETDQTWWFGGGIDLTPHYIDKSQAIYFHSMLKNMCQHHNPDYYPKFKKWADEYFYIKHREETRGIGGVFFDKLDKNYGTKDEVFSFIQDIGQNFIALYTELFQKNYRKEYTEKDIEWRNYRRSRYVEFNLMYDRGTKFGLETNGRVESILMSLPKHASWLYNFDYTDNTLAVFTQKNLKKGIDWVALS